MSAPPEVTLRNMTGRWQLNPTLSDDMDAVMALQGISWFVRATISRAQINVALDQTLDQETGVATIESAQTSLGQTLQELRVTDWTDRRQEHVIFGPMTIRGRFSSAEDFEGDFLKRGWSDGEGTVIEFGVDGEGWTSTQIWGFENIEGHRYYVRRSVVARGEQREQVRMVYDWVGPKE
ncbi:hypothetical protein E8E14_011014 [Neopestalotiopsis sp. 37M]|nr:hypothetical protein E8E14_011014 [Neopestalotiopsis sp. 37M]